MAKVLRVFVILMFLLSIGALTLGYFLYGQRELIRGRQKKLEQTVQNVATKLTAAKDPYIAAIDQKVDPAALTSYEQMDGPLKTVASLAENRYDELYNTRDELKKTKDELTKTQQELAQTKQELDDAKKQIASLQETLTQKEAELAQAKQKIEELGGKVAELNREIEDKNAQVAKLEQDKLNLKDENQRLEIELARLQAASGGAVTMKAGTSGKIVVVNPEWNFVVIDVGIKDGLQPNALMLVHRAEQLIGRVRIVDVRDHMAIADIQRDWVSAPLQEGDRVLY